MAGTNTQQCFSFSRGLKQTPQCSGWKTKQRSGCSAQYFQCSLSQALWRRPYVAEDYHFHAPKGLRGAFHWNLTPTGSGVTEDRAGRVHVSVQKQGEGGELVSESMWAPVGFWRWSPPTALTSSERRDVAHDGKSHHRTNALFNRWNC